MFDEGVYIQQARLVLSGELPYRDFFGHQTPLYPLALAAFASPAPEALAAYRLLSVLATAACGVAVHRIALALTGPVAAFSGALLFLTTPLQYFGLVAMPNAVMLAASTGGFALVCFGRGRGEIVAGALLFGLAVLLKPIAISTALAAAVVLAARRHRWPDLWLATFAGATCLGAAWLVFDRLSDGAFTELLQLQALRHAEGGGFELMRRYDAIGGPLERQGIGSALGWNALNHARTFLPLALGNRTFPLTLLAAGGLWLLWRRPADDDLPRPHAREHRLALTLWLGVPLVFSLVVWDPAFQYYFVQYLPPLALLAAISVERLYRSASRRRGVRSLVVLGVAACALAGASQIHARQSDYTRVAQPRQPGEPWLLFDPFLNFVSGTEPGCGLIDPFNVYGPASLAARGPERLRQRFLVDAGRLIACLESVPATRVGLGYWSTWFLAPPLTDYLAAQPSTRFVPMRLHYKAPGGPMPAAPERLRHGLHAASLRRGERALDSGSRPGSIHESPGLPRDE